MCEASQLPPLQYIVEGGRRLAGTIEPSGNKNAALPIIAAALLTEHPVTLRKCPAHSRHRNAGRADPLGRRVGRMARAAIRSTIHAKHIRAADLDPELCARIRASILLAGPLLARCGEVTCRRPAATSSAGAASTPISWHSSSSAPPSPPPTGWNSAPRRLKGADVFLDEPSVTATENALMAAVAAHGTTHLRNVASEPHVQDLAHFLVALGARIEGIGTNTMVVHGAGDARRGELRDRARPYRGRLADRARRGDALAAAHRARRGRASALDPDGF